MLWASNGDIDSGLHYDENAGGFLMQITGKKHILMFPNGNAKKLYPFRDGMGREQGYSTRFIARDMLLKNKKEFPDLWETTPYVYVLPTGGSCWFGGKRMVFLLMIPFFL